MKFATHDVPAVGFFSLASDRGCRLARSLAAAAGFALAVSLLLSILDTGTAHGAETGMQPRLRADVAVTADVVTIADFFEDAGEIGRIALFRAPDLGTTGPVSARRVLDLAAAAGLRDGVSNGVVEVNVTRLARPVESAEIGRLIAAEVVRRPGRTDDVGIDDLDVAFDTPVEPRRADLRSTTPVRVVSFSFVPLGGRFDALVQIDKGDATERLHLRGTVTETATVATLVRPLQRGDIVTVEDIQIERQPRARVAGSRSGSVDPRDYVGQQARRALRAGQPIGLGDFARPQVVARGDTVTLIFRTTAIQVATRGQAQQGGAIGELIAVVNPQSKRTVHAVVTAPGRVEVSTPSTTVAALAPTGTAPASTVPASSKVTP